MDKPKTKIIDEFADFSEIPSWFTKHLKKLEKKRVIILYGRNCGKNWFYDYWKKHYGN